MARPTPVLPDVGSTIVPPGCSRPSRLGGVDHRHRRPVLDAAAGVEELELGQQLARQVAADAVEAHERRVADEVEQRGGGVDPGPGHGRADRQVGQPGIVGTIVVVVPVQDDGQPGAVQRVGGVDRRRRRRRTRRPRVAGGRGRRRSWPPPRAPSIRSTRRARASSRSGGWTGPTTTRMSTPSAYGAEPWARRPIKTTSVIAQRSWAQINTGRPHR